MANINELLARAAALRDETMLNSISPERAGGIMYDTLLAMNELWLQQGAALVISKIYASVAAMEADTAPVSDLTGLPLRPGQIVVIASSDSNNGSVYRYNGTSSPSWSLVGEIGNLEPVDSLDSDSTSLPLAAHQGKVLDGKISQLGQELNKGVAFKKLENLNILLNNVGQIAINYGTIGSSTTAHHSDMILIGDIKFLYVKSYVNQYTCGVFFYKDNEFTPSNFVGQAIYNQNGWEEGFVPVPNGAVYMAFCSYEDGAEAYTAYYTEAMAKEEGSNIDEKIDNEISRATDKEESLGERIDSIESTVYNRTEQLFDFFKKDVYFMMRLLMSTLKFQANVAGLTACIEINGVAGETYTMAIIDPHTYDELGLQRAWTIAAGNIKPVNGGDYTEYGTSGYTDKYAQITLTENAKYLYINFNRVDETTADAYNNVLEKIVVVKSDTIPTEYIPYLKYVVNESDLSIDLQGKINNNPNSVKKDQGEINRGKALVVGNDGIVVPGPTIIEPTDIEGVTYETQKTLYLGDNILTSDSQVTLGTGWSGSLANGFTHASGNDGNLSININTQINKKYLLRYSSDVLGEYTLLIDIEDLEDVDPYNGTTNCRLGFISNGSGSIIFKAASNYAGSIFNLEILPIVSMEEATEEYIVQSDNVTAGSLSHNITGWINVAIGPTNALNNNENGSRNIAIGQNSLLNLRAGTRNIGIGTFAMLRLVNGERNIAIGADALYWAQRAEDNIIIGKAAAANMAEGNINIKRNIAIGTQALLGNQNDSEDNVAIGYRALGSNPSKQNVALGTKAGYYLRGIRNVVIGHNAQSQLYCTGNDNTVIGADAKVYVAGGTSENPVIINNSIAIGKGANATKSNQCVIGNAQVEEFVLGNKKIVFNNDNTVTWETIS